MRSNRPIQLLTFAAVGTSAYLLLIVVGDGEGALKTLKENAKEPLKAILAAATASAATLLVPAVKRPTAKAAPSPPVETATTGTDAEPTVPLSVYNSVLNEVEEWREYGSKIKTYTSRLESLSALLDTRQAVLRVSAYAILALALFLSAAGFLAPSILNPPGVELQGSVLIRHFACLAAAVAFGGFIIGAIIFRIRAETAAWHAGRSALVATLLLSLSAFLTSLPYLFSWMWTRQVSILDMQPPLLIWDALFRLMVSPIVCMLFAYFGFYTAQWFGKRNTPTNNI